MQSHRRMPYQRIGDKRAIEYRIREMKIITVHRKFYAHAKITYVSQVSLSTTASGGGEPSSIASHNPRRKRAKEENLANCSRQS